MSGEFFTEEMADEYVRAGLFEHVGYDEEGNKTYRLTERGAARAENYIHNNPEGAELWARLTAGNEGSDA